MVAVVVLYIAILLFWTVVGPFFTIWSLNLLFGLAIPYTFYTWCAVMWLMAVLHGINLTVKKR